MQSKIEKTLLKSLFNDIKRRAKDRGLGWELTLEIYELMILRKCFYCGCKPRARKVKFRNVIHLFRANGIDRIKSHRGYLLDNIETACWRCNRIKGPFSFRSFIKQCQRISARHANQ